MTPWFNARKVAQIVAFFAREQGGTINVLKLTKLVYLADRRNMEKYDFPITGDNLVSMDHGPVNSITYDCVNGMQGERPDWEEFVTDRAGYQVGLVTAVEDANLDELSEAELETLNEIWAEFGNMTQYQVRDWTHDHCPEWEDPKGSSAQIPFSRVFKYLGKQDAEGLEAQIRAERKIRQAFA
ncbi:MAG: Panacea domain-containing protein [Parasphingopyxis sp.]|uniref:Panacea domain-containing protein n=1 Tax=Parasphingopyxis sp. TaxID=1920299 RepID=UPI0032EF6750